MATIVKAHKNSTYDYDYIAFSFNGLHSYEDFGIYRVSDGNGYDLSLTPELSEKTAEAIGRDGQYYFNTFHRSKTFNIKFAFDDLSEFQLKRMKQWFNGKTIGDLWFAETPYKVYSAKVKGQPTIQAIPFEGKEEGTIIYKGTGTISFVCYWPYARTPDKVQKFDGNNWIDVGNGSNYNSYVDFNNKSQWHEASGLTDSTGTCTGENPGDLPTPFVLTKSGNIPAQTTFRVGDLSITTKQSCYDLEWNSKTGLVSAATVSGGLKKPIDFIGNSCGAIPVGGLSLDKLVLAGSSLSYNYWYY